MKINNLLSVAVLLSALFAVSCEPKDPTPPVLENIALEAVLDSVTPSAIYASVTVDPETSSYYAAFIPKAEYNYPSAEACAIDLLAKLTADVAAGKTTWGSILTIGSKQFSLSDLEELSEYVFVAFGVRADGSKSSEAKILEAKTLEIPPLTIDIAVSDISYFGAVITVTPSDINATYISFLINPTYYTFFGTDDLGELIPLLMEYNLEYYDLEDLLNTDVYVDDWVGYLTPDTECIYVAFGVEGSGSDYAITSEIFTTEFTTLELPFDLEFTVDGFAINIGAMTVDGLYANFVPEDDNVPYTPYLFLVEDDFDEEDSAEFMVADVKALLDEYYAEFGDEYTYPELVQEIFYYGENWFNFPAEFYDFMTPGCPLAMAMIAINVTEEGEVSALNDIEFVYFNLPESAPAEAPISFYPASSRSLHSTYKPLNRPFQLIKK